MFHRGDHLRRIPTVAAEAPGQGQCLKSDVAKYADGVANLLRFKGILPGPAPRPTTGDAARPLELVAAADGIFVSEHNVGEHVSSADPIGTIVDSFGQVRAEVLPPRAGQLGAMRTFATVYAGEMVAWIV